LRAFLFYATGVYRGPPPTSDIHQCVFLSLCSGFSLSGREPLSSFLHAEYVKGLLCVQPSATVARCSDFPCYLSGRLTIFYFSLFLGGNQAGGGGRFCLHSAWLEGGGLLFLSCFSFHSFFSRVTLCSKRRQFFTFPTSRGFSRFFFFHVRVLFGSALSEVLLNSALLWSYNMVLFFGGLPFSY